jgi:hypothetical protein
MFSGGDFSQYCGQHHVFEMTNVGFLPEVKLRGILLDIL